MGTQGCEKNAGTLFVCVVLKVAKRSNGGRKLHIGVVCTTARDLLHSYSSLLSF